MTPDCFFRLGAGSRECAGEEVDVSLESQTAEEQEEKDTHARAQRKQ
jgi:hypothetical protein